MMKKLFGLLSMVLFLFCITGCSNIPTLNEEVKEKLNVNVVADNNITLETYVSIDDEQLILYGKNGNNYNINWLEFEVSYYDKNGNVLDEESQSLYRVKANSNFATFVDMPYDDDYNPIIPARTEVKVYIDQDLQEDFNEELYSDKIQASYKVSNDEVILNFKNISSFDLDDIDFSVIYLKNNTPIYIETFSNYSIDAYETITDTLEIPEDRKKSIDEDVLIDFDSIKVVINSASEA